MVDTVKNEKEEEEVPFAASRKKTNKVSLSLVKKKSSHKGKNKNVFGQHERSTRDSIDHDHDREYLPKVPLVIPVASNQMRWKHADGSNQQNESTTTHTAATTATTGTSQQQQQQPLLLSPEDQQALQALQQAAAGEGSAATAVHDDSNEKKHKLVIPSVSSSKTATATAHTNADGPNDDTDTTLQQYKADLEQLPDALTEESDCYRQVPIEEFGAAMLRGMGWKEGDTTDIHNNNNNTNTNKHGDQTKRDSDTTITTLLPRPHRLGLGATPKWDDNLDENLLLHRKKMKRPDQFRKELALQKQKDDYKKQREQQVAMDKQRTLQDGSLVYIGMRSDGGSSKSTTTTTTKSTTATTTKRRRARILQLVGVPGLNRVKIQYENELEPAVVKRGEIGELVSRDELEQEPFQEIKRTRKDSKFQTSKGREREDHYDDDERRKSRSCDKYGDDRKRKRHESSFSRDDADRYATSSSSTKRSRNETPQWAIPHIRVRIITEKLGRRYYKEKCMVVDVTPKGVTLQTPGGTVLDRVPERYLETALPKPGGPVVVLSSGRQRHAKGQLLERNSRNGTGVIQFFEDMNVMTLSLDDMAEWCGPLDDDLHE